MSDFGDDYMDDEEIDFEYEEDDDVDDNASGGADLENTYYMAKSIIDDDLDGALAKFQTVVDGEEEKGEWGFKARKQMFKAAFRAGRYDDALKHYLEVLTYVPSAVTRNHSEKSINNLLDLVATAKDLAFLERVYDATISSLAAINNDRLLLKCHLKQAKLYLDRREYARLARVLKHLHAACEDGDEQRKGTQLMEVYALEIQMYSETKNTKKLKALYQQCLSIKSAIPSPRIMGVIRECGGKMHMAEGNWTEAQTTFFESFKNYDDAGSPQRIHVLKYLVLANMLAESEINPFDSQETKPYKNDAEIVAMTNLVGAYQRRDIVEFEKILKNNRRSIMDDPFIREYLDDVLRTIRSQVLIKLIRPYTRIRLQYVADHLNISVADVTDLLVTLLLDKKIVGKIDQVNARLDLEPAANAAMGGVGGGLLAQAAASSGVLAAENETMYPALSKWSGAVAALNEAVLVKLNRA
ncbi:COP9 signalosome complex subunit 2 [Allomyces arbusculus]|nr:COP9 signalosome complex subunit 2 [Allomyces arbusculus]